MAIKWVEKGSIKGPKGDAGATGAQGAQGFSFRTCNVKLTGGASVQKTSITPSDNLQVGDKLVDTDGAVFQITQVSDSTVNVAASQDLSLKGPQGETGAKGDKGEDGTGVNIKGSVATSDLLPEEGTEGDAYVVQDTGNLWIWDAGTGAFIDTGAQIKGPKGDTGDQGPKGDAATITVGTVQTGAAGTQASVVNAGSTSAAVFNFTIPQGVKGDAGPGVSVGTGAPSGESALGACYIDIADGKLYRYEESE